MTTMNQAAFAVLHGVSRKTVTKWKERGWIVLDGKEVNIEASNELIGKYRKEIVIQGNKSSGNKKALPDETPEQAADRIFIATGATMTMDEARRVKENYLALLNQLEYDIKSKQVIMAEDVVREVGEEYAKVRTRLLAIPSEQAPRIHRLRTVAEVQSVLQDVISEALEELTKDEI